jgi:hypothetical protein
MMPLTHCCIIVGSEVAVVKHCWETVISDRIITTIIYVIWHEELLCDVCVLQRVHLSSLL